MVNSNKNQYKFVNSIIVKFIVPIALFLWSRVYKSHKLQKHLFLMEKKKSMKGRLKWLSYLGITIVKSKSDHVSKKPVNYNYFLSPTITLVNIVSEAWSFS